jgi:hypothetical protein
LPETQEPTEHDDGQDDPGIDSFAEDGRQGSGGKQNERYRRRELSKEDDKFGPAMVGRKDT